MKLPGEAARLLKRHVAGLDERHQAEEGEHALDGNRLPEETQAAARMLKRRVSGLDESHQAEEGEHALDGNRLPEETQAAARHVAGLDESHHLSFFT